MTAATKQTSEMRNVVLGLRRKRPRHMTFGSNDSSSPDAITHYGKSHIATFHLSAHQLPFSLGRERPRGRSEQKKEKRRDVRVMD